MAANPYLTDDYLKQSQAVSNVAQDRSLVLNDPNSMEYDELTGTYFNPKTGEVTPVQAPSTQTPTIANSGMRTSGVQNTGPDVNQTEAGVKSGIDTLGDAGIASGNPVGQVAGAALKIGAGFIDPSEKSQIQKDQEELSKDKRNLRSQNQATAEIGMEMIGYQMISDMAFPGVMGTYTNTALPLMLAIANHKIRQKK